MLPTSLSIVQGSTSKPVSSRALTQFISTVDGASGELFIGYPIIGSPEGRYPIDAVWVSAEKGIIIFDLIEGTDPTGFQDRQDDSATKLEARLKNYRELIDRRTLAIPIHTISFAPAIAHPEKYSIGTYHLANSTTLKATLDQLTWPKSNIGYYNSTLSALQNISTIRKNRAKRVLTKPDSRGFKLKKLEDSIATLDNLQGKAVIETVQGVQRIRGLAGSGKTIVLALKAAYLHAQHPEWRIAITFYSRALKGQLRRLINTFSIEQTNEEPNWDNLKIISAWGGPGDSEKDGMYYQYCRAVNAPYYDYASAKREFGRGNEFSGACQVAITHSPAAPVLYDAILIDEAQDFPIPFLKLCYELLSRDKRLVYAYDELQNLSSNSMPSPEAIFGNNSDGSPRVTFSEISPNQPRSDIILKKCYRNSRPVLVTAHALGFGIYRKPISNSGIGLVQMFEDAELWNDIGYTVNSGTLRDGSPVSLIRTEETSPKFLEEHSPVDDLLHFRTFQSAFDQTKCVVDSIIQNLTNDELRHDDIVVINPDPISTREQVGPIRRLLLEKGIQSHIAGVDTDPDVFFKPDSASITFTGIYRAKGNEAGMVYIINAQDCYSSTTNVASVRNRLFTAITRSKAWVRVFGIGNAMSELTNEYIALKNNGFELKFKYPTKKERENLSIVHRDMTAAQRRKLNSQQKALIDLFEDLDTGKVMIDDLSETIKEKLSAFYGTLHKRG